MTRRGRRKHETVLEYETGIEITLYLWTKTLEWEAEVGEFSWKGKDGKLVVQQAKEWLRANMRPTFKPIIRIEELDPFAAAGGQFVGFRAERFWVAMLPDGTCRKVVWSRYSPEDPEAASRSLLHRDAHFERIPLNNLPHISTKFSGRGGTCYLDYEPELWQGIQQMISAIGAVREHLNELIQYDRKALIAGAGLLALPEETGE